MNEEEASTPSPGHKAGQDVDDEEHQLTDEERMLEEIAKEKELIDALPSGDTYGDHVRRTPHQKKLGQLEFQYQFSVEKKRLANALSRFEERHGVIYSEPCLLCLEDTRIRAATSLILVFSCCGGFICNACAMDIKKSVRESKFELNKCPLCREPAQTEDAVITAQKMELAERGVCWAQAEVGTSMLYGLDGFK